MKFKFVLFVITLLALSSCTDNMVARQWGGKETVVLKQNEKLINITWKDNDMWVLTEDTVTHLNYFRESSSFGVFNGEITIKKDK